MLNQSTARMLESGSHDAASKVLALKWVFPALPATLQCLSLPHYVIGRGEDADIRLESSRVSRRHAEVYRQGPIYCIRDLESANGVHLDAERLAHAPLREGQVLRVGDHIAMLITVKSAAGDDVPPFGELATGLFGGHRLVEVLNPLKLAAQHDLPIIVHGETGTGKELVARAIHDWSARKGPFYAVNCAALPANVVEGELFGYRKGAFTGAAHAHAGHLRAAHGGTLFLDEVAELSLDTQAKLLRVVQEREVLPLGENRPVPIDVRIVCAGQESLKEAVRSGRFRADLHARLAGYTCSLPPLRDRREDIVPLFATFAHRYSGGSPPAIDAKLVEQLCIYRWPDNVRELELLTRQLLVLHGTEPVLRRSFLPKHVTRASPSELAPPASGDPGDRRAYELERLTLALKKNHGNVAKAAASLGLSRQRAYRLMAGRSADALLSGATALENVPGDEANGASQT